MSFLQGGVPGAQWQPVENLHLTLRFIGEVDEPTARDIDQMLGGLREKAFDLSLRGVGEFGGRDPHALWAGVAPAPALMHLVAKIESALQRMGLPAETRKYAPHVTLARLRDVPIVKVRDFLAAQRGVRQRAVRGARVRAVLKLSNAARQPLSRRETLSARLAVDDFGFDALHVFVGEAEMVADLVDEDVGDDVAEQDLRFAPLVDDRAAVEVDDVGVARASLSLSCAR